MTDRYNALIVVLEQDVREDDAWAICSAIQQLRGVVSVSGHVADVDARVAEDRARRELQAKLLEVLK